MAFGSSKMAYLSYHSNSVTRAKDISNWTDIFFVVHLSFLSFSFNIEMLLHIFDNLHFHLSTYSVLT